MARLDPLTGRGGRRGRGQFRLRDEELVLETEKDLGEVASRRRELRRGPAQLGPELVEGSERREAGGVLRYAGAAQETGLAAVAGAGV